MLLRTAALLIMTGLALASAVILATEALARPPDSGRWMSLWGQAPRAVAWEHTACLST